MQAIRYLLAAGISLGGAASAASVAPVHLKCSGTYSDLSSDILDAPLTDVRISVDSNTVIVRHARHLGDGPVVLAYAVELRTKGLVHFGLLTDRNKH